MAEMLKPCPLCGSTDVKHYVTNARERNRGVIVCKNCGLRLEAYSDDEYKVAQAYQGDFESAHEFTWEQARRAVAAAWNRRAERTWHDFSDELPPVGVSVLCRGKNGALYVGKPVTFKGNGTRKVWVPRGDQYRTPEKWMEVSA